jgi:hypothetical protein
MKMMLGLLVIEQRLCDCGMDLSFHSSARFGANMQALPQAFVASEILPRRK